jgi:hypothetical protein
MSHRKPASLYVVPVLCLLCSGQVLAADPDSDNAAAAVAAAPADQTYSVETSSNESREPVDCFYESNQWNALCAAAKTPDKAPSAAPIIHSKFESQY